MVPPTDRTLLAYVATVDDPRVERTRVHPLVNILAIAICAVICGAERWDEIAGFGAARVAWFGTFLDLSNGIPSHDTFNRVFAALDPAQFEACFLAWVRAVRPALPAQVIAVDGTSGRRAHDRHQGKAAIHLVRAWAADARLVLAQVKVADKAHEITAIPEVLRGLVVAGCLVTVDAMGCQRAIAQASGFAGVQHDAHTTVDKGHGRLEIRRRWLITDPDVLDWIQTAHAWPGLRAIGMVQTERRLAQTTTVGTR